MSRKYSDNKYDKPDVDARIEQQTIKALESIGIHGVLGEDNQPAANFAIEANHLKGNQTGKASGKNSSPLGAQANMMAAMSTMATKP